MIPRTVEIQHPGCYLNVARGHLLISRENEEIGRIPLADIGLLIVSNSATVLTVTVLSRLLENGAEVIICGKNFQPCGSFLPVNQRSEHHNRLMLQISVSEPLRKNLWSEIVIKKIKNQAAVLSTFGGDPGKLATMHKGVLSDDASNMEAQAARYYWTRLLGKNFRRDYEAAGLNSLLNYGYTVLRACTVRAIVACGLSPAVPIHHSASQNPTALADDLMEPFRPMVDLIVRQLGSRGLTELTPETKVILSRVLTVDIYKKGICSTLTQQLIEVCLSLIESFERKKMLLDYPKLKESVSSILDEQEVEDCLLEQ